MPTLRASRPVAVLLLITLWPALGLAQSAPPAGVVTGIQGAASLHRPVIAQPIPLKFKDDLFLRDQVQTREKAVVRVLLGGKALVTIRELSTFAITEEPGRAAIDLKSGKIAVGVAKSLLKPGEAIEIRTPNAIAAVRGSLLVASCATAAGVPQCLFTALDASLPVTVTPLAGSGKPVALSANQAVGISGLGPGTAVGPVQTITPDVARREAQTASAPRAADGQGASSPMAAEISAARTQEATVLASLIAPPGTGATPPPADATLASATQPQMLAESGSTLTAAAQTVVSPIPPPPSTGDLGVNEVAADVASSELAQSSPPSASPPPTPPNGGGGSVVVSGQNLALAADQTLKTYSGVSVSTDPAPAVTVTNSTVTGAGNLIVVEPGANASLTGPLLNVTGPAATPSALTAGSSVVDIRGVLSSGTTGSFISIDRTVVSATDFLRVVASSLNLAGPLLTDVQGIYAVSGDFLSIQQGGMLTAGGVSPLLQFSGTQVGLGAPGAEGPSHLFTLGGPGSRAILSGSLASLTNNSNLAISGAAGSAVVAIAPGTVLTSSSASPVVDLSGSRLGLGTGVRGLLGTGGTVSIGGSFLRAATASRMLGDLNVPVVDLANTAVDITGALVRLEGGSLLQSGGVKVTGGSLTADALVSTDGLGNTLAISGTAVDLASTSVTLGSLGKEPPGSTDTVALNLGLNQPALRLSSSALTLTDVNATVLGLGTDVGPVPTIPGVGVIASGTPTAPSTLNLKGTLFELTALNATATQPMVQLDQTTISQTETTNDLISVLVPAGLTTTMVGPLLSVSNSTISTSGRLAYFSGGPLTGSATMPFLFFGPSTVTSARQIVVFDQGFSLALAGPLFQAVNTSLQIGGPTFAASFMTVVGGASVNSSSTAPLLSFDGSSVDTSGSLLSVRRSASLGSRSRLTLAGPLFLATNGSSFNTTSLAFGPSFGVAGRACCPSFFIAQGGQLTSTTTAPLIQLSGSSINAGPDLQSGVSIVSLVDTVAGFPAAELVAPPGMNLSGPLLRAESGSTISALNHLLSLGRASLTSTSPGALIQIADSSVSLGGLDPFTNTIVDGRLVTLFGPTTFPTTVTLQGPLFSAVNSTLTTTGAMVGVFDGAALTSTTLDPLISISGSLAQAAVSGAGDNFIAVASSLGLPPTISLGGPLLAATNSTLRNGNGASNIFSFVFIGDSSAVTSTSTGPLFTFDNVNLDSAASILSLRRSLSTATPTKLTLAGPLFSAVNGSIFNTTSLGLGSACCDGFGVRQAAELTSTTTAPLIQLTGSTFNAGPDSQSGGNFFGVSDSSIDGPVTAPAKVSLAGPLLRSSGSSINALFNLLSIVRSNVASTATDPLIQLNNTTVSLGGLDPFTNATTTARVLNLSGTATSPGALTLQGPLFAAAGSQVTTTREAFGVFAGGHLTTTLTTAPLISFAGGSVNSGSNFIHVNGFAAGGSLPTTLSLSGPLFSAAGATITPIGNLLRIAEGASVSGTTTAPLVVFNGGSFTGGGIVNTATGGSLLRMFSQVGQSGTSLTLAGPYFTSSGGATFVTTDSHTFNIADGATLTSTTTSPFASFSGGSATSAFSIFGLDSNTSFGNPVTVGNGVAPNVSIAGTLIDGTNVTFTTNHGSFFFMDAGSSLTQGGSAPLLRLTASTPSGTAVNVTHNLVSLFTSPNLAAPSLSLGGSLLSAVNASITNGDPTLNTHPTVFIGDSSTVVSTSSSPFLSFDSSSVNSAGNLVHISRSKSVANPTKLTLAGPLFAATNGSSFNTTSLGFAGGACCNGFFVSQGAQVVSTTTAPFIQLTNSSFNVGPDTQSGASFFGVTDAQEGGGLIAPARVTLSGPWLSATNSNVSALTNLLSVVRGELSTSSGDPLIQLAGTNVSLGGLNPFGNVQTAGRLLVLASSAIPGTAGSNGVLSLNGAGPLLVASNSALAMSSDLIGILNGGTFTSAAAVPLVQLNGGTLTTQSTAGFGGYVLLLGNTGGPTGTDFASAQLGGGLLNTTGALSLSGGLVNVFSGGQVTATGSTNPFAFVDGGVHTIAGNPAAGFAMFSLSGRNTATAFDAESGLFLGTDRPIQGALQLDGTRPMLTPLLETSGATVTSQKALRMDNALLEATAPLLNLRANGATQSVLTTTGTNAVDLSFQARVSALGSSVIRLDNSVLNVANGSLVNVNASKLTVAGDLVNLLNGATLTLGNGPLITVAGNGFANITGGLINFGGAGGNTVNVTNNLCPCSLFGNVRVALQNGALATNVQISNPIRNPTLGTVNLSPNAALAVVNGAGSRLIVGAQ